MQILLPSVMDTLRAYGGQASIVLLDNTPQSNDRDWVNQTFPDVEVVASPANDFLFSYNWLAEHRQEEILVLLNNDLRLESGFLSPLIRHFVDKTTFAVGATSLDWTGKDFTCGPSCIEEHRGWYWWKYDTSWQRPAYTLFTSGGFMAVDRMKFLDLGGFNRLYHPAYGEDLDLCFRAWRRGWKCIFEPSSRVYHREGGSWSAGGSTRAKELTLRSALLFQWSTLPPRSGVLERNLHFCWMLWRRGVVHREPWFAKVWLRTLLEWRKVRHSYAWMRTSARELAEIERRIRAPMP